MNIATTAGKVGKSQHQYLKVLAQHKQTSEMKKISAQELAEHKSLDSAWLSLNGVVYDVTIYMNYHPGGIEMLDGCGKECSDLFNAHHPWVNAKYLLEKFRIGYLA